MRRAIQTIARAAHLVPSGLRVLVYAWMTATVPEAGIVQAQAPQGAIVGWGDQIASVDHSGGWVASSSTPTPEIKVPCVTQVHSLRSRRRNALPGET